MMIKTDLKQKVKIVFPQQSVVLVSFFEAL